MNDLCIQYYRRSVFIGAVRSELWTMFRKLCASSPAGWVCYQSNQYTIIILDLAIKNMKELARRWSKAYLYHYLVSQWLWNSIVWVSVFNHKPIRFASSHSHLIKWLNLRQTRVPGAIHHVNSKSAEQIAFGHMSVVDWNQLSVSDDPRSWGVIKINRYVLHWNNRIVCGIHVRATLCQSSVITFILIHLLM